MTVLQIAPLADAERARIAAAYGVSNVPETVKVVPRGVSGIYTDPAGGGTHWRDVKWVRNGHAKAIDMRRKQVAALAEKGLNGPAIARELNQPYHSVAADIARQELSVGRKRCLAERRERVAALHRRGLGPKAIAVELGVAAHRVAADISALRRDGLL